MEKSENKKEQQPYCASEQQQVIENQQFLPKIKMEKPEKSKERQKKYENVLVKTEEKQRVIENVPQIKSEKSVKTEGKQHQTRENLFFPPGLFETEEERNFVPFMINFSDQLCTGGDDTSGNSNFPEFSAEDDPKPRTKFSDLKKNPESKIFSQTTKGIKRRSPDEK